MYRLQLWSMKYNNNSSEKIASQSTSFMASQVT
jgi:hypothetical protein